MAGAERRTHCPGDRAGVFGMASSVAAAWLENGKLQLFDVKKREVVATYGKAGRELCDGVATNDARFAVGWRERDGGLWFLHGPTSTAAAATTISLFVGLSLMIFTGPCTAASAPVFSVVCCDAMASVNVFASSSAIALPS